MKEKINNDIDKFFDDMSDSYNISIHPPTREKFKQVISQALDEYTDWKIKERDNEWIKYIQKYSNCGDGCNGCAECRILEITKQQIKPELSNKDKIK